MAEQVDIVVIGLGPGGEDVAGRLAEAGLSVVGIEDRLVGGECPYFGCVPTKMMVRASDLIAEARRIDGIAGKATVSPDWTSVADRIRDEATDDWDDTVAVDRFTGKGGKFVRGRGKLIAQDQVVVGDQVFQALRGIVIATGTQPAVPPIPGLADTPLWTNQQAVRIRELPASLAVLGGGAIGVEFAQVFARFGVDVTVVEGADRLVPMEDPESGEALAKVFETEGITVSTGAKVERVDHDGTMFRMTLSGAEPVMSERLLVATGRRVDLAGLGVDVLGVDPAGRSLSVDDRMRVAPSVWAVGDVVGKGAFTHVSMYHADVVVRDILGQGGPGADHRAVPRVTFTDPEIGSVGLTEAQARDQGIQVRIGRSEIPSSARGWIHKSGNEGFIKLIEDTERGVLVGATSMGPTGGEVLSALAVAVHGEVPVDKLRYMIYAYPTFHRAIETAVRELRP